MTVPLRARGATLGLALFFRHRTPDPFDEDDLRLAEELGARAAVLVDNARRYGQKRATALALQRTILPPHPALEHPAIEVASRYLPAHTGAGSSGDWFDVIPLSGARVPGWRSWWETWSATSAATGAWAWPRRSP
ncbi:hypothetical protein ACFY3M_06735 [Streptomyces mirabilis]|uniref:hypothetical protein n=1 Tax=Streptomyces mirabilis TaxID=68239 RepID=UPI0036B64AF0